MKFHIPLLLLLLAMQFSSCVDENQTMCVQYGVSAQLVTGSGVVLPSSNVGYYKAYLFLKDKFDHKVSPESDGSYLLSFDKNVKSSLVIFGLPTDSVTEFEPKVGDDIASVSAVAKSVSTKALDGSLYVFPGRLYYGRYDYDPTSATTVAKTTISMFNKPAFLHVIVEHAWEHYGKGSDYKIVLQGLRNGVAFDGTVSGDSVTYTPPISYTSKGYLEPDYLKVLPTKTGEAVTVSVYKANTLIYKSSLDTDGKAITVAPSDNKLILIDFGGFDDIFNLKVMPWEEYHEDVSI